MIPTIATVIARSLAAATVLGLLLLGPGSASAIPEPGPRQSGSTSSDSGGCALERVETQLVRCDSLTGAGASAPRSVLERAAR